MTKWQRVEAAIAGDEVDRVPICLWKRYTSQFGSGSMQNLTIHPATDADFDSAVLLYSVLLENKASFSREFFAQYLKLDDHYLEIARLDDEVVGLIAWTVWPEGLSFPQRVCFIQDLVVVPEMRKQGIGSAMLAHVRQWAKERGIRVLHLQTSIKDNVEFYRENGYTPCNQGLYQYTE